MLEQQDNCCDVALRPNKAGKPAPDYHSTPQYTEHRTPLTVNAVQALKVAALWLPKGRAVRRKTSLRVLSAARCTRSSRRPPSMLACACLNSSLSCTLALRSQVRDQPLSLYQLTTSIGSHPLNAYTTM